jgi:hypothetical protein
MSTSRRMKRLSRSESKLPDFSKLDSSARYTSIKASEDLGYAPMPPQHIHLLSFNSRSRFYAQGPGNNLLSKRARSRRSEMIDRDVCSVHNNTSVITISITTASAAYLVRASPLYRSLIRT